MPEACPIIQANELRQFNERVQLYKQPKSLLLIEDDLALIGFIDSVLSENFRDLQWEYVTSGEKALQLMQRRADAVEDGSPYSLVITDIFLEGETTGFDVWLEAQQRYPEMPFVFTSHLSFDRYFSILRGVQNCPVYLPKPLTISRCQSVFAEYF